MTLVTRPAELPTGAPHVVVEASAGTGKTYFLEHRVVDLVLREGARIEQLAIMTFTEKAVQELRRRIRRALVRASEGALSDSPVSDGGGRTDVWHIGPAEAAALRQAIRDYDNATITTIHGFCLRVAEDEALAVGRLLRETQVAQEDVFESALRHCMLHEFAREPEDQAYLQAYLTHHDYASLAKDLWVAYKAGAASRPLVPALPEPMQLRTELCALEARHDELLAPLKNKKTRDAAKTHLGSVFAALSATTCAADFLQALGAVEGVIYLGQGTANSLWRREPALAAAAETFRLAAVVHSLTPYLVQRFMPRIAARIQTVKSETGTFDYDDMIARAHTLLCGPSGDAAATRLRARWPWALVDECQDTDDHQWRILRAIWRDRGLTIVGDPKQSIFSFRGADVTAFRAAQAQLLADDATLVRLTTNRRASRDLVTAQNAMTHNVMGVGLLDADEDAQVNSTGDIHFDEPPVTLWQTAGYELAAHVNAVAAEIKRLHGREVTLHGHTRRLGYRDMMVLATRNADVDASAALLRAHGLPCVSVLAERLFATKVAADIADVLDAVTDPRHRAARLRALLTDFFPVPLAHLASMAEAAPTHPHALLLWQWHELATRRDLATLFARLVPDSGYATRALLREGGERDILNARTILAQLAREAARGLDLAECVRRLRRWMSDEDDRPDDFDIQPAEDPADAVQLLTVHRAKGAEAPVVFLVGGIASTIKPKYAVVGSGAQRAVAVTADVTANALNEAARLSELRRVAYVAITRAQVKLIALENTQPPKKGNQLSMQRLVADAIHRAAQQHSSLVALGPLPTTEVQSQPAPTTHAVMAALTQPRAPRQPPLLPSGRRLVSYTSLSHKTERSPIVAPTSTSALPLGAATGRMIHELLEDADLTLLADDLATYVAQPTIRDRAARTMAQHRIDATHLEASLRLVHRVLTQPLPTEPPLPALLHATRLAREVPVLYPADADRMVVGVIDVLAVYDNDAWVIDYKTDAIDARDAPSLAREQYGLQARLYAAAAARCLPPGVTLRGALVWYLRPDVVVPVLRGADLAQAIAHPLAEAT